MRRDTSLRPDQHPDRAHSTPRDDDRWLADLPNDLAPLSLSTDLDETRPEPADGWDVADLSGDVDVPHHHDDCGL